MNTQTQDRTYKREFVEWAEQILELGEDAWAKKLAGGEAIRPRHRFKAQEDTREAKNIADAFDRSTETISWYVVHIDAGLFWCAHGVPTIDFLDSFAWRDSPHGFDFWARQASECALSERGEMIARRVLLACHAMQCKQPPPAA